MPYKTKQEQFEALCRVFPIEAIKEREQGGTTLYYYPVEVVRNRLNQVFAGDYEFRVRQVFPMEKTVDVTCELTLNWVDGSKTIVEESGSSDILLSAKGSRVNEPMKTALSDGLKRCLSFIGCGAELYNEVYRGSIQTQRAEKDKAEQESKRLTCQECQGRIEGGTLGDRDLSAEEVIQKTRTKFRKRLCLPCARLATAVTQQKVA